MKKVTRRALRGHFHSPVVPAGHENLRRIRYPSARRHEVRILRLRSQARSTQDDISLRRIRYPSARRDEVRILRLRSQARFAQDDSALRNRVRDLRFGSYTLTVILSLRRIRNPSARRDKLRILRLRSQARFAQDDSAFRASALR